MGVGGAGGGEGDSERELLSSLLSISGSLHVRTRYWVFALDDLTSLQLWFQNLYLHPVIFFFSGSVLVFHLVVLTRI